MKAVREPEHVQTIIIGAGQAGLSVGYFLARLGLPFVIVEANQRVGDTWRRRWDSLRLFTPARFDSLAGMPFPASPNALPTKDEMAAYLESYADHFHLPVRTGVRVERVYRRDDRYVVDAGPVQLTADQVVVAMANFQKASLPACAAELSPDIVQLHSSDYRNPSQLQPGPVLIVGGGNSGAEIALEVGRTHPVFISGRDVGHIPFRLEGLPGRLFLTRLVLRGVFHRVLTLSSPLGRKVMPKAIGRGGPLIRVKPKQLEAAGVQRVARVAGARGGTALLEDGRTLDVANVIWCTGFQPGFSWIDLPVFGQDGRPIQERGVARDQPGLYFVGLHFLYAMSSTMIHGVARDAEHVARVVGERVRATSAERPPALRAG